MPRYHYELDPHNGHIIHSYVDADNKTQARKMIAAAYREDTPRSASSSGFVPFHKCKLTWNEETESSTTYDDSGFMYDFSEDDPLSTDARKGGSLWDNNPLAPSDPRIGVLIKDGNPAYYAHLDDEPGSGYFEGTLIEVEHALNSFEHKEHHGS